MSSRISCVNILDGPRITGNFYRPFEWRDYTYSLKYFSHRLYVSRFGGNYSQRQFPKLQSCDKAATTTETVTVTMKQEQHNKK